ncbi:ATP-binding protein [Actinoallomurus acaciae]|uniref:ATP-binding protein n=1 Tax=Actinoallomurus acaciae TaxID=502577 RepID=A0ABV5YKA5_9ACTN
MTGERAGEAVDEASEWLSTITQGERWHEHRPTSIRSAPQTMSVGLAAVAESVKEARDFARAVLLSWGLTAMYDDVRLVVSELVTNALRYAGGPAELYGDTPIRLSLLRTGGRLTCAVTDPCDQIPVRREPDWVAQSGRGLHLVEAFSHSWNWAPLSSHGKVVWACFLCPDC